MSIVPPARVEGHCRAASVGIARPLPCPSPIRERIYISILTGYISFRYDLGPYLKYGDEKNVLAVRVDNAEQPNSRWYSGSGIYRNVWLVTTNEAAVEHWGTFVTTEDVSSSSATIHFEARVRNSQAITRPLSVKTTIYNAAGKSVAALSANGE